MVRHGEAESNARGYLTAAMPGPPLTGLGRVQARLVAAVLARRVRGVPAIVASPLRRALETALPAAERYGVALRLEPDLREVGVGAWEGRSARDLVATDASFLPWRADPERHRPPGGEIASEVALRVRAALEPRAAEAEGGTLVAFSHQNALAALLVSVQGLTWSAVATLKPQLPNAVIAHLRYDSKTACWLLVGLDPTAYREAGARVAPGAGSGA